MVGTERLERRDFELTRTLTVKRPMLGANIRVIQLRRYDHVGAESRYLAVPARRARFYWECDLVDGYGKHLNNLEPASYIEVQHSAGNRNDKSGELYRVRLESTRRRRGKGCSATFSR